MNCFISLLRYGVNYTDVGDPLVLRISRIVNTVTL